jgi:hypothetical protein
VPSLNYYETKTVNETLRVAYRYHVQEITNNRYYAKKETRYDLASVAVKIENLSSVPITITRKNFKIYSGNLEKVVMSPAMYASKVKQRVGVHMLHALWGPWGISYSEDTYGKSEVHGYYIPAGLIVGIGNAVRASNANKENKATLEIYEIWNKEISPGKTLYGLITIESHSDEPLSFAFQNNTKPDSSTSVPFREMPITRNEEKSYAHDFYVIPLTGKAYSVNSKIHTTGERHFIIVNDPSLGTSMVYPSDTKTLSRMTPDGKQLLGIPNGDYWLFKILEGKINGYYILAEEKARVLSHIQKGDGEIVSLTPQSLADMVDGDPDIMVLINKGKYIEAIKAFNGKN